MFRRDEAEDISGLERWLTWSALVTLLGLVAGRATFLEMLRDPFEPVPGFPSPPRGPGAETTLILDLLGFVPAMLVCVRAVLSDRFPIRMSWASIPLMLMGAWAMVSVLWAHDKFVSLVSSFHVLSLGAMCWAGIQLVRDWRTLRVVAGVAAGLFITFLVHGAIYHFVDKPELKRNFESDREKVLAQNGIEPGSYQARQLEKKITSPEMSGFSASPNTFGAELVLLGFVVAAVGVQRWRSGDGPEWWVPTILVVAGAYPLIKATSSNTALMTPMIGIALIVAMLILRDKLTAWRVKWYWLFVGAVAFGIAAVVGHGIYHGTLPGASMAFRWRYWVASWGIFSTNWLKGIGWEDFQFHYLLARVPMASEAIKDPHSLFVRTFVELGIVGGLLSILWLARSAWEIGAVKVEQLPVDSGAMPVKPVALVLAIGVTGLVVNVACSVDFGQTGAYVALEIMRKGLYLLVFVIGGVLAVIDPRDVNRIDDREATWLVRVMAVGAGLFLLHNMIDFSMWEFGAGPLFVVILSAVIGIRQERAVQSTIVPLVIGVATFVGVMLMAGMVVVPVIEGESHGRTGDEQVRAGNFRAAELEFRQALDAVPWNADYASRAGLAAWRGGNPGARTYLDQAISLNPMKARYFAQRGDFLKQINVAEEAVIGDFKDAVALNPREAQLWEGLGDAYVRYGRRAEAREAYAKALQCNHELEAEDAQRWGKEKVESVKKKME